MVRPPLGGALCRGRVQAAGWRWAGGTPAPQRCRVQRACAGGRLEVGRWSARPSAVPCAEGVCRWQAGGGQVVHLPLGGAMCRGRVQAAGWRWAGSPPDPRWCRVQRACAAPCFCSVPIRSGCWFFVSVICPEFVLVAHAQLFLVSHNFFAFCCSRRGVSRSKHCSTSPASQVGLRGPFSMHICILQASQAHFRSGMDNLI